MSALVCAVALALSMSWAQADAESNGVESKDCTLMRGTVLGEAALRSDYTGYGDLKYWIRTFELQRDNANAVAQAIKIQLAPLVDSTLLKVALKEVAADIQSAMQTGYGNVNYWISAVTQSNGIYSRAAQKLSSIRRSVCE